MDNADDYLDADNPDDIDDINDNFNYYDPINKLLILPPVKHLNDYIVSNYNIVESIIVPNSVEYVSGELISKFKSLKYLNLSNKIKYLPDIGKLNVVFMGLNVVSY